MRKEREALTTNGKYPCSFRFDNMCKSILQ